MKADEALAEINAKILKHLRGAYLGWKQGEALERATRPDNPVEALGLGNFSVEANLAINTIVMIERVTNDLSGCEDDTLSRFAYNVAVASGSRVGHRLQWGLETIGQLGQYIEVEKGWRPTAGPADLNTRKDK